jgi:hypothetical protein
VLSIYRLRELELRLGSKDTLLSCIKQEVSQQKGRLRSLVSVGLDVLWILKKRDLSHLFGTTAYA